MKALYLIFCLILLSDALPRKKNSQEFSALWSNSPFTTKPPPAEVEKKMGQWSLAGIMNHSDGNYTVTIINKKDRADRRRLNTDGTNMLSKEREISIVEVEQAEGFDYRKSRVKISENGEEGWIEYDDSLLAVKPNISMPNAQNNVPGRNTSNRNNSTNRNTPTIRRPSMRQSAPKPPGMDTNSSRFTTSSSSNSTNARGTGVVSSSSGGINGSVTDRQNPSSNNTGGSGTINNQSNRTTGTSSQGVISNLPANNQTNTVDQTNETQRRRPVIRRVPISR